MPLVKKKKKKKGHSTICEEHLELVTYVLDGLSGHAAQGRRHLVCLESLGAEKKKRKSMSPGSRVSLCRPQTGRGSDQSWQEAQKTQEGEKGQGSYSFVRQGPLVLRVWECIVYSLSWEGWRPGAGSLGTEAEARESQGAQREDEEKKKNKIHWEGDPLWERPECSWSLE